MKKIKNAEFEEKEFIEEPKIEENFIKKRNKDEKVEFKKENNEYTITNNVKKKSHINKDIIISSIITLIICIIIFVLIYILFIKNKIVDSSNPTSHIEKTVTVTDSGIADAVEKVYDSVVVVETFVNDKAYASGTGFVFKKDSDYGYILTNHHVISDADSIKVTLTNNETVEAKLVGSDEYSDIAILTIDVDKVLLVAEIGSSSDMRVGDTTFAVGAPIDSSVYSWSVTRGILSGKNRLVEVSSSSNSRNTIIMEVLQTDTAINSGNSGGPLCNANGEVIGITNMKLSSSTIEGMGFAIPIDDAISYSESIISGKGIARPYLGVALLDYSNSNYNNSIFGFFNWGTTQETGVYVQTVESNSAAAKAGIKVNDKITKVNGVEVEDVSHFKYELYKYEIGETITITIERDGATKDLKVTLESNVEMN